jgi:hypothetical protein
VPPDLSEPASVGAWLADRLEEEGIAHALGGAVALAAHGFPRNTADVDMSVFVPEGQLDRLFDTLERAGCVFDRERARAAVERIYLFTVRCGRVAADLFVSFHPHHHEALARRVSLRCPDGRARWFLSAEDMVIHKLAMSRQKDLMDLELLFTACGNSMDLGYVRRWVEAITPPGDPRRATLDDLQRRFAPHAH